MINYLIFKKQLNILIKKYNFLKYFSIGKSVLNNEIYCIKFGNGNKQILYSAGIHANEYITSILLLKFIEDLAISYKNNSKIYDYSIQDLYNNSSIYIIPMVNPDGINLVNNFYDSDSKIYNKCLNISNKYPNLRFPLDWKANINGVDLNSQFPANWKLGKKLKSKEGYYTFAPRDFAGEYPISEPEAKSLYEFTLSKNFDLILCFHSQGEVIYWNYNGYAPKNSFEIAKDFAQASGYSLEDTPYLSSFGGFRDWFINNFNKPGFTIEVRKRYKSTTYGTV